RSGFANTMISCRQRLLQDALNLPYLPYPPYLPSRSLELLARVHVRTPVLDALGPIHRTLAHHLREQEVDHQLDLARLERGRRVRHRRLEIRLLQTAAAVAVGEPIECRHAGSRTAALDRLNQPGPIEARLPQVRSV